MLLLFEIARVLVRLDHVEPIWITDAHRDNGKRFVVLTRLRVL